LSDEVEPLAFHDLMEPAVERAVPHFRSLLDEPAEGEAPEGALQMPPPEETEELSQDLIDGQPDEQIDLQQEARRVFEDAFAQGEKAGQEMGMKKAEPLIERLNQYLSSFESFKTEVLTKAERLATLLALTFAESIVMKEVADHREITLTMIRKALETCEEKGEWLVRVPKDDAWMISAQGTAAWKIVPDEDLKESGFLIETNFGVIDGRISKQLEELRKEFLSSNVTKLYE
jgi:flagellar assembly protein FliH